jgi:hypothetical protein
MRTINKLSMLAAAAALTLVSAGGAFAHGGHAGGHYGPVHGPGSSHNPIVFHPVHGPGSSHNPIVFHPVHGPGSSHNPIVFHPVHGPGSSHNPIVCTGKHPSCGATPGGLPGRPGGPR